MLAPHNVLAALPTSTHPGAKAAYGEVYNAEDREPAPVAANAFKVDYGFKAPKAAAKITDDLEKLLAYYDYSAEHWILLWTRECHHYLSIF